MKHERLTLGEPRERAMRARELGDRDRVALAAADRPWIEDAQARTVIAAVADQPGDDDNVESG